MVESSAAPELVAVVLAAGQGTRMKSSRTKVLHELLGAPMVSYPVQAAFDAGADRVVLVIGHQAEAVREAVTERFPERDLRFVVQPERRGTGHAVLCALPALQGCRQVAILSGDTPALDGATIERMRSVHREADAALTLATFEPEDPIGYGRVLRDEGTRAPLRIVECRDASPAEKKICEVNAGLYLAALDELEHALARIGSDNAQGEMYLTDVLEVVSRRGLRTAAVQVEPEVIAGVNTRAQLAELEAILSEQRNRRLMESGVTMRRPETVRVELDVTVGRDTELGPGVQLCGKTTVGEGCLIEAGAVLRDCRLADGVHVRPYVVAEQVIFGERVVAGPFAHLRPATVLAARAKIGNFVEAKKAWIGEGSKANHLTYLGDCEIGAGVNVGAGTITCNYDGAYKHRTVIEDGVFVGSDTQFVAPVRVRKNATIGAGTTVTREVPEGSLVVTRAKARVIRDYYEKHRQPREERRRAEKAAAAAKDG